MKRIIDNRSRLDDAEAVARVARIVARVEDPEMRYTSTINLCIYTYQDDVMIYSRLNKCSETFVVMNN